MDLSNPSVVMHYPANTEGKDYIVGDLHGCLDDFNALLELLKFDKMKDRMFSVGDLVDRGPDSLGCALLVYDEWFHTVRGNHEQMFIDFYYGPYDDGLWSMNGGNWVFQHPKDDMKVLAKYLDLLPYIITVGEGEERFNIVHAELTFAPDITDEVIDAYTRETKGWFSGEDGVIWGRDNIRQGSHAHNMEKMSLTYCGHTPVREPAILGRQMYIDGGAVFHHTSKVYETSRELMIACHQDKIVHRYNIAHKTVNSIPYDQVMNLNAVLKEEKNGS